MSIDHKEEQGRQLLADIAGKNEAAIASFYNLYQSTVYRFALSRLNDPHAAADILNEVMMEVWKFADRFEGRSKLVTWLLGIAHFKVIDHFRKLKKTDHDELSDQIADESPGADQEQIMAATRDAQLLQRAMGQLSAEHREILHLVFFQELGYEEISSVIGVPEGTVKSRVFHAKKLIKQKLQQLMVTP